MTSPRGDGPFVDIYRRRIGEPTSRDEVRGFWVFVCGIGFLTVGIALYAWMVYAVDTFQFLLREISIPLIAMGFAMVLAGPVIRLPFDRWVTTATYLGQATCFAAIVWFVALYPRAWPAGVGDQRVIVLYLAGVACIVLGALGGSLLGDARSGEPSGSE